MGRAYTDEEREEIRIKLLENALELYHDKDVKALNIRDLTKKAGISLGCFYSFYKDKDDLILDVIKYRGRQKILNSTSDYKNSLKDPVGYVSGMIFNYITDLKTKAENKKMYEDVILISARKSPEYEDAFYKLLEKVLKDLIDFWEENGYRVSADSDGISYVITGASCMLAGGVRIRQPYFDDMLKEFLDTNLNRYLKVEKQIGG
ncbi:MAG: TetR/AcrR family transcriptional regulator [Lachnospiraceae bacterium]|nr:TetR/AcrR family transcriptional regulator [Lachnospiraceae bacterium]